MALLKNLLDFFFPDSIDLSGRWQGSYRFGNQYSEKTQQLRIGFIANLKMKGISIEGSAKEDENGIPDVAVIDGSFGGRRIAFVKTYAKSWSIDSEGKFSPGYTSPFYVNYTGIYNAAEQRFTGEWKIEAVYHFEDGTEKSLISTGTWEMKRKTS
jgi:hypothetical protein